MQTEHIRINPHNPEAERLAKAAGYIYRGELLAFPTETVYGLGAKADCPEALQKIFTAKARPQERPLLVHVRSSDQVRLFAAAVSSQAQQLMQKFWPGPLALILPARTDLPKPLLGPGRRVGFRCPANQAALELLRLTGPLAAPSANLSGHPSPLTAEHVKADLDGRIAAVLDAGAVELGLESTVLDLTGTEARILRTGSLNPAVLAEYMGAVPVVSSANQPYQLRSRLIISKDHHDFVHKRHSYQQAHRQFSLVITHSEYDEYKRAEDYIWYLPEQQNRLFDLLHQLEQEETGLVLFTPINWDKDVSPGIKERLARAVTLMTEV